MRNNSFAGDDNITLLAKGVVLKGEIHVEGTVRIDGRLDGEIQTKGQVIIGEDGIGAGIDHSRHGGQQRPHQGEGDGE